MKKRALATALSVLLFAMSGISVIATEGADPAAATTEETVVENAGDVSNENVDETGSGENVSDDVSSDSNVSDDANVSDENGTGENNGNTVVVVNETPTVENINPDGNNTIDVTAAVITEDENGNKVAENVNSDLASEIAVAAGVLSEGTQLKMMASRAAAPVATSSTTDDPTVAATGASGVATGAMFAASAVSSDPASVATSAAMGSTDPSTGASDDELKWDVSTEKSVTENTDGTYLLKVAVKTELKNGTTGAYNIVYLVDVSTSLSNQDLDNEKQAVKTMSENLENRLGKASVKFALVQFGSTASEVTKGFTDATDLAQKVDSLTRKGSTDMGGAIEIASKLLNDADTGVERKVIVLMTDGQPNNKSMTNQAAENSGLSDGDKFIAVYFDEYYNSNTNSDFVPNGEKFLRELTNDHLPKDVGKFYKEGDSSKLSDTLDAVSAGMGKLFDRIEGGELIDTLSSAVDFANSDYTLSITDKSGATVNVQKTDENTWTLPDGTQITVTIDAATKKATVNFPSDYKHQDGWKYELATLIRLNDAFKASYNGQTEGKGDANTGTYAGQDGVYTNIAAESLFRFTGFDQSNPNGTTVELPLQKPVIVITGEEAPQPVATYEDPAEPAEDTVYVAPEAPEVMGAVRAEDPVEDPIVLGARRNARTSDFGYMIPVILLMLSVVTFIAARKMEKEA